MMEAAEDSGAHSRSAGSREAAEGRSAADAGVGLDVHLPFSYWLDEALDRKCPALRPSDRLVASYAAALIAEIESLGADLGESAPLVGSVYFSGGYLGLLDPEAFRDVLRAVRRSFPVAASGLEVDAVTFPGSLDMYAASAYLDEHLGALMFEVPTLSAEEARETGAPNALQALDKSVYVLRSYGAAELGLVLPTRLPGTGAGGRTEEAWRYIAGQISHYQPAHVELVEPRGSDDAAGGAGEDGQGEGALPMDVQAKAGATVLTGLLRERGYREVDPGFFTRNDEPPAFVRTRQARRGGGDYLGIGLGAESRTGGFYTKNTCDLRRYLANASDCRKILDEVRQA